MAFPRRYGRAAPLAALALLVVLLWLGFRGLSPAPPVGPFLDPVHGVWAVARGASLAGRDVGHVPSLGTDVRVVYDDRGVPHIFATSVTDAVRALGYVVARDRLFQLELATRAAAGRLTELAGARALEVDRAQRGLGLPRAAERKLAGIDTTGMAWQVIEAYAEGVNAWIGSMGPEDVPIEYHLLGVRPSAWEPVQSIHLLNRMAWTLAYDDHELRMRQVEALVGREATDALFPRNSPIQEPIVPNGRREPRVDVATLPPPRYPDAREAKVVSELDRLRERLRLTMTGGIDPPTDAIGSNNWAVAPRRARNGRALLAGDPHLELTLPSIWYEAHLVVPGELDVYGVTIPGSPGIIIGFNRDIAWSFTNVESDVLDYFVEVIDDPRHPTRYRLDGVWTPLDRRPETYRDKAGNVIAVDTTFYTHRGPLIREGQLWLSMRWTAHDTTNESEALARAVRSRSVTEWLDAMTMFAVPAQNGIVADRSGAIAIRSTGRYPVRAPGARGDRLQDGSSSASDWRGTIPVSRYPFAINPAQGFLASANQQPFDPRQDSTYFGAHWYSPWRAMRINSLLRADSSVTPDAMRQYQTDPGSARADAFVPAFLTAAAARRAAGRGDALLDTAARLLSEWDRRYTKENERAVLFEAMMSSLQDHVWDELARPSRPVLRNEGRRRLRARTAPPRVDTPADQMLILLLQDPSSPWWDGRATTDVVERRDDILTEAMREGYGRTRERHGDPTSGRWRWDRVHHASIYHLLRLETLSRLGVAVQGGPSTLAPSSGEGRFGPSWRMVVELGPEVRAWTIYPGGQSGNPASTRYADRVDRWSAGVLDSALVPRTEAELPANRVAARLTLTRGEP
ncbi:MAG TPA: penicillin acylase family protein [Gemmatimonadaceae bacterium]|nr:penicillin acylase family protein [Gemmatimonadaceae bacterium]